MLGLLQPMLAGGAVAALGYRGRGGTLDMQGMLFANGCSWAHAVCEVSRLLHIDLADLLSEAEIDAVDGIGNPAEVTKKTLASI